LQIEETSPTHCESHLLLQQNESSAQILAAQVSQVPVSLTPELQIEWAQVLPPPPPPPPPPVHDCLQTDWTSPTQIESHELLQQNESAAQTFAAQVSHAEVRAPPVEQIGCEQLPPVVQTPPGLQVWPLPQVPQAMPQRSLVPTTLLGAPRKVALLKS